MHTRGLVLSLLALVVVASGCVDSQDAISVAESNSDVQNFLEENPNPTVQKTFLNASSGSSSVLDGSQFSQRCEFVSGGEDHYRVDFIAENETLSTWVEADSKEFVCYGYNYPNLEETEVPEPRISLSNPSQSLSVPNNQTANNTQLGNITFDVFNLGEPGEVMLKVEVVDDNYTVLNTRKKTFDLEDEKTLEIGLAVPPGSAYFEYEIGATANSETRGYQTTDIGGFQRWDSPPN